MIQRKRKPMEADAGECEKLEKFFKRESEDDNNDTGKFALKYDDSRLLSLQSQANKPYLHF